MPEGALRVLFLTHRLPYTANRGDRLRALHILRFLAPHADIDLVSLVHSADEEGHARDLSDLCASVSVVRTRPLLGYTAAAVALPTRRPLTHALLDGPGLNRAIRMTIERHRPDVVLAYCSGMARLALEPALGSFPMVLDMLDVDSEKWKALGATADAPMRWVYKSEATRLARFERRAARHADAVLVVNEREQASLLALEPTARVHVIPNGVALEEFRPPGPPSDERRVAFCGVMNYAPNVDAAVWFGAKVWPLVRRYRPDARLSIIGSNPVSSVKSLAESDPTIDVTGTVADVRPHLWSSAIAVAPLRIARGVQNKVLEAVAAGLPCVVTSAVRGGLPQEVAPACLVEDSEEAFANRVLELLARSPAERRVIAGLADLQSLTWPARLAPLLPLLDAACRRGAASSTAPTPGTAWATPLH